MTTAVLKSKIEIARKTALDALNELRELRAADTDFDGASAARDAYDLIRKTSTPAPAAPGVTVRIAVARSADGKFETASINADESDSDCFRVARDRLLESYDLDCVNQFIMTGPSPDSVPTVAGSVEEAGEATE